MEIIEEQNQFSTIDLNLGNKTKPEKKKESSSGNTNEGEEDQLRDKKGKRNKILRYWGIYGVKRYRLGEKIMREEAGKLAKKDPFGGEKTKPRSAQGPILDKFELNPECQNGYFYWKCKSLFCMDFLT